MSTVQERVVRGAAWLDGERPGWWRRIDLRLLSLPDVWFCPLAQEYGDYNRGVFRVHAAGKACGDLGFVPILPPNHRSERREYRELTDAWRAEVARRRKPKGGE